MPTNSQSLPAPKGGDRSIKQFRVVFDYFDFVAGHQVICTGSTRWFDSLEEASGSKWINELNSKIISREYAA